MEDAKRFGEMDSGVEVVAGTSSSQMETAPPNFSWPVAEVPRHAPDYQNVHTEYRDNFPGWHPDKVPLPPHHHHPSPIPLTPF
jgi:hypothetical protein